MEMIKRLLRRIRHCFDKSAAAGRKRAAFLKKRKKKLAGRADNISVIASNCNGGVVLSDLGMRFNSPFVNLFIKSGDYIKLISDLKSYMESDLVFVKEEDPVYGNVDYPTAYLKDVKIYFMHYKDEQDARSAWEKRKARIDYDNLWIMYTDRDGCTEEDLIAFDSLPYEHKVVFTHVSHPEIRSSFYIKGYEDCDSVGVLTQMQDADKPVKRVIDQFDFVKWFTKK